MTTRRRGVLPDGLLLAAGTLLAVRVPAPSAVGPRVARTAMLLAPVVALVPGTAALTVAALGRAGGLAPLPTAVLAVAVTALLSRGLHLDGLADTADGLASGYDRGRALEVMRRGDTGPAGAATLVLVLLLQVGALAQCLGPDQGLGMDGGRGPVAALVAVVAGRAVLPVLCSRGVRAARESGLGATVTGTVPRAAAAGAAVAVAAACAVATAAAARDRCPGRSPSWPGVAAAALLARRCVRRFGGVSGDVLGACVETATTAALLTLALPHP